MTAALLFILAPLLAAAIVQLYRPIEQHLKLLLSFSGAFLLSIAVLHLLPHLFVHGHDHTHAVGDISVWILAGFLVQVVLEFFSKGLEHGHTHFHTESRFPAMVFLSLWIHAFVEGMPFAGHGMVADTPFVTGILLHKMPVAIALAAVLLSSQMSKVISWLLLVLFAFATPTGMLIGSQLEGLDENLLNKALALAVGMLLHISTTIIFESSTDHRFNGKRFLAVVLGVLLAAASLQFGH